MSTGSVPPEPVPAEGTYVPLAFAFSGGISLGVYEAGVDWSVVQFLGAFARDDTYRRTHHLPQYDIAALAGTSAGNINTILTALQYCDAERRVRADSSLYWAMWVTTGRDQLFPADARERLDDQGVLSREHFRDDVEPRIDTVLKYHRFWACDIPLDIVVTKVDPGAVALGTGSNQLLVPTQRYVVRFDAVVRDSVLSFEQAPPGWTTDKSLGSRIVLRGVAGDTTPVLPHRVVYRAVEASAAYPVAWSTVSLRYVDPDHLGAGEQRASFMDGGLFDNLPLGVAFALVRPHLGETSSDGSPATPRYAPPRPAHPQLVYVDPSHTRGALSDVIEEQRAAHLPSQVAGLMSVVHLVGGFVPTARTYELQTFARGTATTRRPSLVSIGRAHPIIGDHLNAFGAFLGRPFREFDFFAGVSDGVYYVVHDVLCNTAGGDTTSRGADSLAKHVLWQRACVGREFPRLVDSLPLDRAGRYATLLIASATSEGVVPRPRWPTGLSFADSQRVIVLEALEHATGRFLQPSETPVCNQGDFTKSLLCADRFHEILDAFRKGSPARHALDALAASAACRSRDARVRADECLAEPSFLALVDDPEGVMHTLFGDILQRVEAIERDRAAHGNENGVRVAKAIAYAYRSTDLRPRRGVAWDPSSIPPNDHWWEWMHAIPYYLGGTIGGAGSVAGWEPLWHAPSGADVLAVAVPIEITHFPRPHGGNASYFAGSVGIGPDLKTGWFLLNQVYAGVRVQRPIFRSDTSRTGRAPEVALGLFGSKVRISTYYLPQSLGRTPHGRWAGTIAVSDVNGLLYNYFR